MTIESIIGFCIVSAVISIMLKQYKPEYALLISIICAAVVVVSLIEPFKDVVSEIESVVAAGNLPGGMIETIFKSLGICILAEFASEACRDAGENSIASKIELAANVIITLLALPFFSNLLNITASLLKN